MKIKRFEANSMSEALRMIKKEFGEDAVILSAKNNRKSGRLFAGKQAPVVVTAAIDPGASDAPATDEATEAQSMADHFEPSAPVQQTKKQENIGRILEGYTPITRTGLQKLQPKLVSMVSKTATYHPSEDDCGRALETLQEKLATQQGLNQTLSTEIADRIMKLVDTSDSDLDDSEMVTVLSHIITAKNWVAPIKPLVRNTQRIVVMVGPSGAGKTTTVAKIAAHTLINDNGDVAVISLDDQRIAGTTELERYAQILNFSFAAAAQPQDVAAALERASEQGLIVIDTPGIGLDDPDRMERLGQILDTLDQPEVHLLINAGAREQVMARTIDFFMPLGVNRLLPTHLDWAERLGPFLNQLAKFRVPVAYLCTGTQIPEAIIKATATQIAAMLLSVDVDSEDIASHIEAEEITVVQRRSGERSSEQYVANCNSDIFHHQSCKSVTRISKSNVVNFQNPDEAMGRGFKPCRMCCMDLLTPKPIDRSARSRYADIRN